MLLVDPHRNAPRWVVRLIENMAGWLSREFEVPHPVDVRIASVAFLGRHRVDPMAIGLFQPDQQKQRGLIILASKWQYWRPIITTKHEAGWEICHTMAHEFAHYEQWRDQRPLTERGVNRRADNLTRRYLQHTKGMRDKEGKEGKGGKGDIR